MGPTERERLDDLVEVVTVDTYDPDERLGAFAAYFEEALGGARAARLLGVDLEVEEVAPEGAPERGLAARCRLASGEAVTVSAVDLVFEPASDAAWVHAGYRWSLGLEPFAHEEPEWWEWPEWLDRS